MPEGVMAAVRLLLCITCSTSSAKPTTTTTTIRSTLSLSSSKMRSARTTPSLTSGAWDSAVFSILSRRPRKSNKIKKQKSCIKDRCVVRPGKIFIVKLMSIFVFSLSHFCHNTLCNDKLPLHDINSLFSFIIVLVIYQKQPIAKSEFWVQLKRRELSSVFRTAPFFTICPSGATGTSFSNRNWVT